MIINDLMVHTDALDVTWADNNRTSFPTIWLRDKCPSGLHPQTQEPLFDLLALDASPVLTLAKLEEGDVVLIYEDGHISHMPVTLLKRFAVFQFQDSLPDISSCTASRMRRLGAARCLPMALRQPRIFGQKIRRLSGCSATCPFPTP